MTTRSNVLRAIPSACLLLCSTSALAQQVINGTTETVPGSKPNPWNTGTLTVGTTGTGTLNINAGGVVNSTGSVLGSTATGNGTVNVSGAGANWTVANGTGSSLTVGSLGSGALTIRNGARGEAINGSSVFVGQGLTGRGTVTVSGTGSTLSVANAFSIAAGDGRVESGGSLSAVTATLNRGTLLVTGSGSDLSLINNVFINNNSSLTIADRATATAFRGWIGDQASTATATVTVKDGGTWKLDKTLNPSTYSVLTVARRANGELNVESGGAITGVRTTIGGEAATGVANVTGVATVTGAGSRLDMEQDIIVGDLGRGTLQILQGGNVTSATGTVGAQAGSSGSVTVSGNGSLWKMTGNLQNTERGTIIVENGGKITAADANVNLITNDGAIRLTGTDSTLSTNAAIRIGASRAATLDMDGGAKLQTGTLAKDVLGSGAGAMGSRATLTGQGTTWTRGPQAFYIGLDGAQNTLEVLDGAQLLSDRGQIALGFNAGGIGNTLLVGGKGSLLTTTDLTIGYQGRDNRFTLQGGGRVNVTSGQVGGLDSTNNQVTVTGQDSTGTASLWDIKGGLSVGNTKASNNRLDVLAGGQVQAWTANIGNGAPSGSNTVTVDGKGSLLTVGKDPAAATRTFSVGNGGSNNTLAISGGATVEAYRNLTIGRQLGANNNTVTVSGAGSMLWVDGGFVVGRNGANNSAIISDGARLDTAGSAWIGGAPGSPATGNHVDVTGAGSSWQLKGDLAIGSALAPLSDGVEDTPLPVTSPGDAGDYLLISGGASVTQTGGATTIGAGGNQLNVGAASTFTSDGAITVGSGSRLSLSANSRVNGGSLAMSSGSQLDVFAQENNSSLVTLSGRADLGGTLNALIDGRSSLSHRFLVLQAGEVEGTFDQAVLNDYSANLDWSVLYTPTDVFLQLEAQIGGLPGLNENQNNVGNALDDFFNQGGALPPSFLPILNLSGNDLGQALSQLSGEVGASGGAAAAASANTSFLRSMLDHPCAEDLPEDPRKRCRDDVWAAAFGSTASLPGNDARGSHDTTTSTAGIATGWDHADADMRVGVAIAGGGTGWNLDGSGMGSGDSTFLQLGAYGTKQLGQAYASFAGAYALQSMSTERRVTALQSETLDADFIANAVAGRGEAGYRFAAAAGLGLTPYAALQGQAIRTPAYEENGTLGSGTYALSYDADTTTVMRAELGLGVDMAAGPALFSGRAAWAHDWLTDAQSRAGFQSLPGTSFIVNGAEAPEDLALVSASANMAVAEQAAVTARFDGEFGSGYQSYAGTLALTYSW